MYPCRALPHLSQVWVRSGSTQLFTIPPSKIHYFSTTTIAESYINIEDRISAAYEAFLTHEKLNIKVLSRDFNVLYSRLLARIRGRKSYLTRCHGTCLASIPAALTAALRAKDQDTKPPASYCSALYRSPLAVPSHALIYE